MTGKTRKPPLHGLLIPDVGENLAEIINTRPLGRRHETSDTNQLRGQTERLQRDRLSPCIRTGQHKHRPLIGKVEIVSDHFVRPEQQNRMSGRTQTDDSLFLNLGPRSTESPREVRAGSRKVNLCRGMEPVVQRRRMHTDIGREFLEDASLLSRELGLSDATFVVDRHDLTRLDVNGLPVREAS